MYNALYSTLASYIAKINVREHRKGNQEWIVQKHKTKNKQNKKTQSRMDSPETQDEEQTKQKTQSRMDSPETQDQEQTKQKNNNQEWIVQKHKTKNKQNKKTQSRMDSPETQDEEQTKQKNTIKNG